VWAGKWFRLTMQIDHGASLEALGLLGAGTEAVVYLKISAWDPQPERSSHAASVRCRDRSSGVRSSASERGFRDLPGIRVLVTDDG